MRVRLALLVAVVLVPALFALLLLRSGARFDAAPVEKPPADQAPGEGVVGAVDRFLGGALDPGPLSSAHASLAGVGNCLDCHGTASHVIDARCVACHEEIGVRAQKKIGWHGTFDEPCRTCHLEHKGSDGELIAQGTCLPFHLGAMPFAVRAVLGASRRVLARQILTESFVIGVIALVVVGPERLPRVAKTMGHLLGRLQRYVGDVKADINREIELDELRKLQSTMQDAANSVQQTIGSQVNFIEAEVKQAGVHVEQQMEAAVAPMRGIELIPAASPPAAPDAPTTGPSGPAAASAPEEVAATGKAADR